MFRFVISLEKSKCFFILFAFLFTVNSKYFFKSWCCILDYFILNCKLWDKFLISMIILILIISYILIFYRNFELIFEFMALKRAAIYGRNVCLSFFFCVFLYLIVIILFEENKKNLTLYQNSEKWTKILWILGQYNRWYVIKHVTLKSKIMFQSTSCQSGAKQMTNLKSRNISFKILPFFLRYFSKHSPKMNT